MAPSYRESGKTLAISGVKYWWDIAYYGLSLMGNKGLFEKELVDVNKDTPREFPLRFPT